MIFCNGKPFLWYIMQQLYDQGVRRFVLLTGYLSEQIEEYFGNGEKTLGHELGHALGLWHTFHGVEEVEECGDCYEFSSGFEADIRGDFCSDTPPAPFHRVCESPDGYDCLYEPWGETLYDNIMSYSDCQNMFTSQQAARMHAWIGYKLSSICINLN